MTPSEIQRSVHQAVDRFNRTYKKYLELGAKIFLSELSVTTREIAQHFAITTDLPDHGDSDAEEKFITDGEVRLAELVRLDFQLTQNVLEALLDELNECVIIERNLEKSSDSIATGVQLTRKAITKFQNIEQGSPVYKHFVEQDLEELLPYFAYATAVKTERYVFSESSRIGVVQDIIEHNVIVVALEPNKDPHIQRRSLIEVEFEDKGTNLVLISQIERVYSEEQNPRILLRVVAVIDKDEGRITQNRTLSQCLRQPAFPANSNNLKLVFTESNTKGNTEKLDVGFLLGTEEPGDIPVVFNPVGFMRHTAVFGQSGSGKSFSFGILLEQMMLNTAARFIVFDPNADFVNFHKVRRYKAIKDSSKRDYTRDAHEHFEKTWQLMEQAERFLHFGKSGPNKLQISFQELDHEQRAILLGLDPDADREEYSILLRTMQSNSVHEPDKLNRILAREVSVPKLQLQYRITNRELAERNIWSKNSITKQLKRNWEEWRFATLNLKDADMTERSIVSGAVLRSIYEKVKRDSNKRPSSPDQLPTFIVIDEAHNLCPSRPWHDAQKPTKQIIEEIAAEGRKYGAYLMLLSQSPSKISEQVLDQCGNVILMRMNSSDEVRSLGNIVDQTGDGVVDNAMTLQKGQAICSGGIVMGPTTMQFDTRHSETGGDDLSKRWANGRGKDYFE